MSMEVNMFAEERKSRIVEIIDRQGKIVVPELCEIFGVSASTIRNDLRELENEKLIRRTHGGAISQSKVGREPLPTSKETKMVSQKEQIAGAANELVEDGDVIAVSSGTTIFSFIKTLQNKKDLTVIVNNVQMAVWLEENTDFMVVILGGILRRKYHYVVSPVKSELLELLNIDKAFLSCNGVQAGSGITTPDIDTAMNYRRLAQSSQKVYVLSDSSKIGTVTFAKILELEDVTAVITDAGIEKTDRETIESAVEVIIAGETEEKGISG